ncbi:MAG: crossover junction endodeoxyribonuclease RuvC [Acidimicrobiia bacterium]
MFVLGVDPGLSRCGYGVVERVGRRPRAVAAGVVRTDPALDVPRRLAALQSELRTLVAEHRPDVVVVERLLFQVNVRSAIPVAQAAGLAMVEAVAAGSEVVEYSPNEVKQAVAGHGGADKHQVQRMVQALLGIATPLRPADAADAVALALCHLAFAPLRRRTAEAQGGAARAANRGPQAARRGGDGRSARARPHAEVAP